MIGFESVATHIVHTPKLARRMLDEVGSPNLQIIFSSGQFTLYSKL